MCSSLLYHIFYAFESVSVNFFDFFQKSFFYSMQKEHLPCIEKEPDTVELFLFFLISLRLVNDFTTANSHQHVIVFIDYRKISTLTDLDATCFVVDF